MSGETVMLDHPNSTTARGILLSLTFCTEVFFLSRGFDGAFTRFEESTCLWRKVQNGFRPPDSLSLGDGEVHVWRVALDQPDESLEQFRGTLEPTNLTAPVAFILRNIAATFRGEPRVSATRAGRYLRRKPERLRFSYGAYGKPALAGEEHVCTSTCRTRMKWRFVAVDDAMQSLELTSNTFAQTSRARTLRGASFRASKLKLSMRCRRRTCGGVFQMLDAQGGVYQSDRQGIVAAARRIRRDACSWTIRRRCCVQMKTTRRAGL